MRQSGYKWVLDTRRKNLPTRLGIAAVAAGAVAIDRGELWPLYWLAAVFATQAVDYVTILRFWSTSRLGRRRLVVFYNLQLAVNCAVYSSLAYLAARAGQPLDVVLGAVIALGSLLHAALAMRGTTATLLAATIPHSFWFFSFALLPTEGGRVLGPFIVLIGGGVYLSALAVGVSQTTRAEAALARALAASHQNRQRAEHASRAKSDFLAVMSHEIRTPMNAVISTAHLLNRTQLDEAQKRHVMVLSDASESLMGLLNDLLDFSKIEAGKMELDLLPVDVPEKLRSVARLWSERAEEKGLRIALDISANMPTTLRVDPLRLQQVLSNLLSNAVKFTNRGGVEMHALWREADKLLVIEVVDSGCGIDPKRIDSIFSSFEQATAGTSRTYGGTGLGLSISRSLARLMGGDLSARSAPGEGSTFRLTLPAEPVRAQSVAQSETGVVSEGLAGKHILAADDNELNRLVLQSLLEPFGCALTLVENGAQALEEAQRRRFDAILLDMRMPVMDGLEAGHAIRNDSANRATPIVALTADAMDSDRARWEAVGVAGYLTKPVDPAGLGPFLMQVCARKDRMDAPLRETG